MTHALPRLVVLLGVLSLLPGCGSDSAGLPPGNIQLSWLVGTSGCDPSGVDTVAVFLTGGGKPSTDLYTFRCSDAQGTITGLKAGNYDLSFRGRDGQGVDRFGAVADNVEVRSGGTTTVQTVHLSALPATLNVSWYFENGRMCSYNSVDTVDVTLFQNEYVIYTASATCSDGALTLDNVQANDYIVDIDARDVAGQIRFNGQEDVTVDRGDSADVEVRLAAVSATPR